MPELGQIFHNIKDHLQALQVALDGQEVRGAARDRLLEHMVAEERDNQRMLTVKSIVPRNEAGADRKPATFSSRS